MTEHCTFCSRSLDGLVQTHSSLYGALDTMLLCPPCAAREERRIESRGTNNVPELLELYDGRRSFI